MRIKVSEATNTQLDYLAAKSAGVQMSQRIDESFKVCGAIVLAHGGVYSPSTDWAQGGPIIEREKITVVCAEGDYNQSKAGTPDCYDTYWVAEKGRLNAGTAYGPQGDEWGEGFHIDVDCMSGPTPLIAAMRCYLSSKLGDEVEIPEELL